MKKLKMLLVMLSLFFISGSVIQAKEKINVYLFYGDGCPHCENAITFFDGIEEEYKSKFNLVKYETWYNEENGALMEAVASKLGVEAEGVPFIVIGNESMGGYSEAYNDDIRSLIVEAYDNQTDIVKDIEVNGSPDEGSEVVDTSNSDTNQFIVIASLLIIIIGVVGLVFYAKKSVN